MDCIHVVLLSKVLYNFCVNKPFLHTHILTGGIKGSSLFILLDEKLGTIQTTNSAINAIPAEPQAPFPAQGLHQISKVSATLPKLLNPYVHSLSVRQNLSHYKYINGHIDNQTIFDCLSITFFLFYSFLD